MTKRGLGMVVAALGFGLVASGVQAGQALVPEQSEIAFVGKQMGVPTDG
jgi:hypothetical protein